MRIWQALTDRFRARASRLYWQRRVRRHGARAVFNLGYEPEQLDAVTRRQKEILFPLLRQQLRGDEGTLLDLGCGPGRFTVALAELFGGRAIGVDPMRELLDLAPAHAAVEYRVQKSPGRIPLADKSIDVVWVCLVLGVITNETELQSTIAEIKRVLRPNGLLFLVENTAAKPAARQIQYRSVERYRELLPFARLQHLSDYEDLGEPISILAGRVSGA
jgi:SAM-dependent methyltransferase